MGYLTKKVRRLQSLMSKKFNPSQKLRLFLTVVEHACQSAESIVHQDNSGKCQELIDMTRKFMRGEVDIKALNAASAVHDPLSPIESAAVSATLYAARSAARSAVYNAASAYYAANAADGANALYAAYAARDAASDAAMKLYQEWIMEELLKYESEEFCQ